MRHGGAATLESYGFAGDLSVVPVSHLEFLDAARDYYETDDYFFVHGNYWPDRELEDIPPRVLRWTALRQYVPEPHFSGKTAVVGHTADRGGDIQDLGHLICIDTYCYGGGWLTALDVGSLRFWQTNESGESREDAL